MDVKGRRFQAFAPLGSQDALESHIAFFAEVYNWEPDAVLGLPCARRFRLAAKKQALLEKAR